jgi:uncharacterized protein (DUF433 family)
MATAVDIGTLIVRTPNICGGRPRIAGTCITVLNITCWYKMGLSPEEIIADRPHIPLAGMYAALAYYHANREEVEREIAEEDALDDHREREHARRQAFLEDKKEPIR